MADVPPRGALAGTVQRERGASRGNAPRVHRGNTKRTVAALPSPRTAGRAPARGPAGQAIAWTECAATPRVRTPARTARRELASPCLQALKTPPVFRTSVKNQTALRDVPPAWTAPGEPRVPAPCAVRFSRSGLHARPERPACPGTAWMASVVTLLAERPVIVAISARTWGAAPRSRPVRQASRPANPTRARAEHPAPSVAEATVIAAPPPSAQARHARHDGRTGPRAPSGRRVPPAIACWARAATAHVTEARARVVPRGNAPPSRRA